MYQFYWKYFSVLKYMNILLKAKISRGNGHRFTSSSGINSYFAWCLPGTVIVAVNMSVLWL
jgi:hypothetical protein